MAPGQSGAYLIDATPDIRKQLHAVRDIGERPTGRVDRSPVAGLFLTHAHLGHYTGLAFLGFEAVHAGGVPVWATPAMHQFLRTNAPWSQLVGKGEIEQRELAPGASTKIGDVTVAPVKVPHRDEFADTVGFVITGPTRKVFYVPDTEPWSTWASPPLDLLSTVDVAIVDGTFYSGAELPGRDVSTIGHPLMTDTMDLLGERVKAGSLVVYFTHLNHSNPVLDPRGTERETVVSRGFHVLDDGQELAL